MSTAHRFTNGHVVVGDAVWRGADIVVMIHPDYQYDSRLTPHLVDFIRDGYLDVMLGSRIRTRREALAGGMPPYKYLFNRILTLIENVLTGTNLSEWHTGFRAYSRRFSRRLTAGTRSWKGCESVLLMALLIAAG